MNPQAAGHHVFISFSSKDLDEAASIRDAIEHRGFACWMSSRDILSGENFQEAIVRAIRQAQAVVLVFSAHANASSEIKKEVALASTYGIPLIPARLENIRPTDAFAYEFITRQWIDLFPDREVAVRRLCAHLDALGSGTDDDPAEPGFRPDLSLAEIPHNMPEQANAFIGRQEEKARLIELLGKHRLVTALGAGGLGKTRLAIEVAAAMLRKFPDGVWLIELAPLSEPQLVAETIAGILSLEVPSSRKAIDVVAAFLHDRKALLLLDNCEHLIEPAAQFADRLIRSCPQIAILATSREPLALAAEQAFRMPPLGVPPAGATDITAAAALGYPAVQLFVERARSVLGGFELSDREAPAVAAICRRLDGIALAIELAAPRLKMLPPSQILEKLDERFRILTGGNRTALPRQQTLRAMIDWSFNLLSDAEKALMRRLSAFSGGWTMAAASAVCSGEPIEEWEILDLLSSLIDKSLVSSEQSGSEMRYDLLESTRHYAREKLQEAGEQDWPRYIADYMVGLMRQADRDFETVPTPEWQAKYGAEIDNLRAAIDLSFAPGGDVETGLQLVAYSGWLWTELDLAAEKRRRVETAYGRLGPATESAVAARIHSARGAGPGTGLNAAAKDDVTMAVELARQSGDPLTLGKALIRLATNLIAIGALPDARKLMEEARQIALGFGRTKILGTVLNGFGIITHFEGNRPGARAFYEEALAIGTGLGDSNAVASVLQNLAELSFLDGEVPRAIEEAKRAFAMAEEECLRDSQCLIAANLAAYLILSGDTLEGGRQALSAAKQARSLENEVVCACALQHFSAFVAGREEFAVAATLQGFIDETYRRHGMEREPTEQATYESVRSILNRELSDEDTAKRTKTGAAMTLDEAIEIADGLIAETH